MVDRRNPSAAASLLTLPKIMQQGGSHGYSVLRTAYTYQEKRGAESRGEERKCNVPVWSKDQTRSWQI